MSVTPETIHRVLRSWIAIEVLTPQVTKGSGWNNVAADRGGRIRNRRTDAQDGPTSWRPPQEHDLPPWNVLPDPPPEKADGAAQSAEAEPDRKPNPGDARTKDRPWYSIILGALPAKDAFARLDAAFRDEEDEDEDQRKTTGHIIAASVVLDEWGIMVPDSLAVASFAWGLGHMLRGGAPAELSAWEDQEHGIKARFSDLLTPVGSGGQHRSLAWSDLRGASLDLGHALGVTDDVWIATPCAIETIRRDPPDSDILSSFFLPDLGHVLRDVDALPSAASCYLGLNPPTDTWDALSEDRRELSRLLDPGLFPLARWPGPGLHPLTLLQQAAVNAIVRELEHEGLAAVNGPPGTGKTTLLRDLVAHVLVARATKLAAIKNPSDGLGDIDLMDSAIVVASSNNAAVENISLELPVRKKALDSSIWRDGGLDYFGHTATALLHLPDPDNAPEDETAWGLIAARLGNAANRHKFFGDFWREEWGLDDWLNRVAWPDAPRNRERPPGKLVQRDPPPRHPEAMSDWRRSRSRFQQALKACCSLCKELQELARAGERLRELETQLPPVRNKRERIGRDYQSARKATSTAGEQEATLRAREASESAKLAALTTIRPSMVARLFRTEAWHSYEINIRQQVSRLEEAQQAAEAAKALLAEAIAEERRHKADDEFAETQLERLLTEAAQLTQRSQDAMPDVGDTFPGPGFWNQRDEMFQQESPWNGGRFREARDALFTAAIRLHHDFIVAGARALKPSLNAVAKAALGGSDSPKPTARDWGVFFLLVPVVSTTFASIGRMFQTFGAAEIGWLLIDEAGQAAPQHAVGAVWRARRAVAIGDPLQIEPIASTPKRTTRLIFQSNDIKPAPWVAPKDSAQTLADRASRIQGHFPIEDGGPGQTKRITGIPLLVHRRCERPMFELANRIAYADRMVFATASGGSPIRDLLGDTAWIHVDAPSTDKWVQEEGLLIARTIADLCARLPETPDIYVISPFRIPAIRLKTLLLQTAEILTDRPDKERRAWIEKRVGTVHTFQSKEAESVILMLGAGRGAKAGSRNWAGSTPNLLNVAATRAKRSLYIVGNRDEWQGAGVFREAARMVKVRRAEEWSSTLSLASAS